MSSHINTILCLGDSYTIGEGVPIHETFPYQAVQKLRKMGYNFHAPEIVAQTGWTTFELAEYLIHHSFQDEYDYVTLLIGVNNQYRDLALEDFTDEFEFLLKKAIGLCDGNEKNVLIFSIPDWGITPFAKDRNTEEISTAINQFNTAASILVAKYDAVWIDIGAAYRSKGAERDMLASDGLHPSGKMYEEWAMLLSENIPQK